MASPKEIRTKILSIKNTQKITRAMEMVAASKMRRAQERMFHARPYAERIRTVISHLAKSHPEYRHSFLNERPIRHVGLIIITSDRGLCGGLNMNVLRTAIQTIREWHNKGAEVSLCLIGSKAENFFKRFGGNIIAHTAHLGDTPSVHQLVGTIKVMLDSYAQEKLDALFLIHNQFVNSMNQKPHLSTLLPIAPSEDKELRDYWDYIYEPEAKMLLDLLLRRYIESQIYRGVIENIACEQAARMVAMKNASENANDFITTLQLAYNKARQASITQELAEIVAGASAVEGG